MDTRFELLPLTLGHQVVSEIRYRDFTFEHSKPFEQITQPHSVQMVEGQL